jgi:hypothetical protein
MRIRDLKRKSGETVVPCWPPVWASAVRPGSRLVVFDDGDAFNRRGRSPFEASDVLIGAAIKTIGELDVP